MVVNRRIGAESSASRSALMDAVEAVMLEQGYAALTARRVAERADLKHQLVFYYFETMDELVLATYRRHIGKYREMTRQALQSACPLHTYWTVNSSHDDAVLNMEFMAMSNHNAVIRAETVKFGEEIRALNLQHIAPGIRDAIPDSDAISPVAVVMALNFVGSLLGLETALGISGAHDEIRTLVNWCVDRLEPGDPEGPETSPAT